VVVVAVYCFPAVQLLQLLQYDLHLRCLWVLCQAGLLMVLMVVVPVVVLLLLLLVLPAAPLMSHLAKSYG
jgi:hypothetical protein